MSFSIWVFFYPILSNLFISNLTYNALHFETQIFSVCWFVHVQVKLDNADVIIHVSVVNCNDWLLLFCHKMYFACEENLWSKLSKMQNINYKISQFQVVGHCLHSLLFYNHYQIINREKVRKTKCCESSSILFRHQNLGVRPREGFLVPPHTGLWSRGRWHLSPKFGKFEI